MTTITDVLARLERCYDSIPRVGGARVEVVGPFALFLRDGPGWPYYARPRLGETAVTTADVEAVRVRQRELCVPEVIEWVDETTPALLPAARASGLSVQLSPLMVLDPGALATRSPRLAASARTEPLTACVRLLEPDAPSFAEDVAMSSAVAAIGFGARGTGVGAKGPAERDAIAAPLDTDHLAWVSAGMRSGHRAQAVASTSAQGILATGALQGAESAAEVVGVATLPAARRRGLGAAVTAALARHALDMGAELVFLSAASADVARLYARIGFRRVGTACIAERAPRNAAGPGTS